MKRFLVLLLCITTLLSVTSLPALAAEAQYRDDDTATVSEVSEDTDDEAEVDELTPKEDEEIADTGWSLLTEAQFSSKLDQLRAKYPDGDIWSGIYYEYGAYKADTCWGYACQMMYEVFGAMFYSDGIYSSYMDYDSNVSAGDWVRIDLYGGYTSGTHSIFITKVTDKGVYYTDGNGTGVYNQIRWDGYYTWAEFNSMFRWRVHLPGNNLKGQDTVYTVAYNGNGGSGSMSSETLAANGKFKLKSNGFKRSGYTFGGYTVRRSSDGKWYTTDAGWQTQSEIYDNEYTYKVYPQGNSYTLGTPWIGGINSSCTFTFYAQWIPDKSTVEFFDNYSGYNYILGSDLSSDYSDYIYSRDNSVYSVSVDSFERLNNADSLKIVGKSAGEMGSDLAIGTSTGLGWGNGYSQLCDVGDDQDYYLRFCAKSSVEGAKMYIRWGFSGSFESVTLTKSWKIYTVLLPKNRFYGAALHPYFDKKGTYYLNSLAMGIGRTTNVTPESGSYAADPVTVTRGSTLTSMPTPARSGYSFVGWFTEAEGGERVTTSTVINSVSLRLYAHWVKDVSYTPVKTLVSNGHLYELYDNQMGWEDAEEFCEELGGHLITVDSNYENTVAYDMISDRQGYCWIGLNYNILTDSWEWASGDWYIFNRWYKPSYGTEYSGEHYAMMYPMNIGTTAYAGTWDKCVGSSTRNSYYCYYNSFFICEYDSTATLGDADGSGDVDITDASVVQHKLIGAWVPYGEEQLMCADVDGDDSLTMVDATFIQRYSTYIEIPYIIGTRI